MARPSKVPRPTEDEALSRVGSPVPRTYPARLYELLAAAVRRHDRHGAQLLRHLLVRAMSNGPVGAVS